MESSGEVAPVVADMASMIGEEWRLFVVGHALPAGAYVDLIDEAFGGLPTSLDVIEPRDGDPTTDGASLPPGVTVRAESPGDLTAVSVHANEFLTRAGEAECPVFVWYDSITHALEHARRSALFRSLHRLSVRIRAANGTGYYWLSPGTNDRTRATFGPLFDGVVPA